MCSEEFLQAELDFIINSFLRLKYPLADLISLKEKAKRIISRREIQQTTSTESPPKSLIIVPHSQLSEPVQKLLGSSLSIIDTGGERIGHMLKHEPKDEQNEKSVVYRIPCGKCSRVYYGETGRGLETRIREHRTDLRYHRSSNAFVVHAEGEGHLPDWSGATSLKQNFTKNRRKVVEVAFIAKGNTINTSPGFFRLASIAATVIRGECDTFAQ